MTTYLGCRTIVRRSYILPLN